MAKPLDQFGGWLRFFQVMALINFITSVLALGLLSMLLFTGVQVDSLTTQEICVEALCLVPYAYVLFRLFTCISVRDVETPGAIARWAYAAIAIAICWAMAGAVASIFAHPERSLAQNFEWPNYIFWILLLPAYLQRSKRVKAFYGTNYPEKSSDPYIKDPIEDMIEGWRNQPGKDQ